jgi:hypothetical protein
MKKERERKKVRRRCGTSPAPGVYLPEGRLPSTFGVPCSLFDIPAEGGSFFERSLEKSVYYYHSTFCFFCKKLFFHFRLTLHDASFHEIFFRRFSHLLIFLTSHLLWLRPQAALGSFVAKIKRWTQEVCFC